MTKKNVAQPSPNAKRDEQVRAMVFARDFGRTLLERQPDSAKREEARSLAFSAILESVKQDYTLEELAMFSRALAGEGC